MFVFQNVTLLFQLWFKSLLLSFIYIASYYSTQVCPLPRCADISHICVCVCLRFQRASRSQWSSSPVRMGCSPTSITPAVLGNTRSPSPGEVSTSQRGELYAACVTALPQHITSSNLNDWVCWGLIRPHVQDLIFFVTSVKQIEVSFHFVFSSCVNISNGVRVSEKQRTYQLYMNLRDKTELCSSVLKSRPLHRSQQVINFPQPSHLWGRGVENPFNRFLFCLIQHSLLAR